jgi:hypothetical protein
MKRKKVTVLVTYKFAVSYEHPEHLENIKGDLQKQPYYDMAGGGAASDGKFYGYSCKMIKAGSIN